MGKLLHVLQMASVFSARVFLLSKYMVQGFSCSPDQNTSIYGTHQSFPSVDQVQPVHNIPSHFRVGVGGLTCGDMNICDAVKSGREVPAFCILRLGGFSERGCSTFLPGHTASHPRRNSSVLIFASQCRFS